MIIVEIMKLSVAGNQSPALAFQPGCAGSTAGILLPENLIFPFLKQGNKLQKTRNETPEEQEMNSTGTGK